MTEVAGLVDRVLGGERRALARVLSLVENETAAGREAVRLLYPHSGRAHTIGITGPPGSGKSTLAAALARHYRRKDKSVAIVAVDPTSPFSHGAVMGDRVRMQDLTSDTGVFVRSMASRGALGGLAPATAEVVPVLDAAGKDLIIIETVGAGQDEVDVAGTALTTIVVFPPSAGDDIQAMKAGIVEIADIFVVNKADLAGANAAVLHLESLAGYLAPGVRPAPVIRTIATRSQGIEELAAAIDDHRTYLQSSGLIREREEASARRQLLAALRREIERRAMTHASTSLDEEVEEIVRRKVDPWTAAEAILQREPAGKGG